MGSGASILISHPGLERLVRVQLGERLGLDGTRTHDHASAVADAIASILDGPARLEPAGDDRFPGLRLPFVSRPCYANFATSEHVNSLGASIEPARSRCSAFLGSSMLEWNRGCRAAWPLLWFRAAGCSGSTAAWRGSWNVAKQANRGDRGGFVKWQVPTDQRKNHF